MLAGARPFCGTRGDRARERRCREQMMMPFCCRLIASGGLERGQLVLRARAVRDHWRCKKRESRKACRPWWTWMELSPSWWEGLGHPSRCLSLARTNCVFGTLRVVSRRLHWLTPFNPHRRSSPSCLVNENTMPSLSES